MWLTVHGVAVARLKSKGWGQAKPVAENSTEDAIGLVLLLTLLPLSMVVLRFGHHRWTSELTEPAVALGWSNPRYPWREDIPQSRVRTTEDSPFDWQSFYLQMSDDPATRAARLHGLWLVFRERLVRFGYDPMQLLWSPELNDRGRQLLIHGTYAERFAVPLRLALDDAPRDRVLRADLMFGSDDGPNWNLKLSEVPHATEVEREAASEIAGMSQGDPFQADLWQALAEAASVLLDHAGSESIRLFGGWMPRGGDEALFAVMTTSNGETGRWDTDDYAHAIERLGRARLDDYLEKALEERAASAWQALGLDSRMARYAAGSDRSIAALAVGRHVALHLTLLQKLAEISIQNDDWDRAARWVELAESTTVLFDRSVRSNWIHNYVRKQYGTVGALAQLIQGQPDCPSEVTARMAVVVARNKVPPVRAVVGNDQALIAFSLDSVARAALRVATWTLIASAIGSMCLVRRSTVKSGFGPTAIPGSKRVAAVALFVVLVVFVGLEFTNLLGEHAAANLYTFAFTLFLMAVIAGIGWLIIADMVQDQDLQRQKIRRRICWLVACGAMLVVMKQFVRSQHVEFSPSPWRALGDMQVVVSGSEMSPGLRLFLGALLVITVCWHAWLRWRRARSASTPTVIHPLLPCLVAAWLGFWMVLGPPGAWLRNEERLFINGTGDWSDVREAADHISFIFELPFAAKPSSNYVRTLLMVGAALRVINAGLWLVLACGGIWLAIVYRTRWFSRQGAAEAIGQDRAELERRWVAGAVASCFWIGLFSLFIHSWSTLATGYVISRALVQSG